MDMNQKLDYSKLTPIELKAIAISYQNMKKDEGEAFNSSFPYMTSAIEVLAEQLFDYPADNIEELKTLHDELLATRLLKISLVNSLVETLSYFQNIVLMRISDIENGVLKGVNNGSIN